MNCVDRQLMTTRPATRQQLEILATVKEITGALVLRSANDTDLTDLSFLRNLRIVRGRLLE